MQKHKESKVQEILELMTSDEQERYIAFGKAMTAGRSPKAPRLRLIGQPLVSQQSSRVYRIG